MRSHRPEPGQTQYCCIGCQLASALTADNTAPDANRNRTAIQLGLAVFFSMNVMVFTMALWSWDAYAIAATENAAILKELLRWACLLFATPVVLILGRPLVASTAAQLARRVVTTDCLLVVGVAAAFAYSVISVLTGQPHVYFEVTCMILVAVTLGRWLEAEGKHRAMRSLQTLQNLLPENARVIRDESPGKESLEVTPLADVAEGQVIRVLPGERVPLDGTILAGYSFVDGQLVTGESRAICAGPGARVYGGTVNLDGRIDIRVNADATAGVISRLVESVRLAASQSSRPQRMADRLATIFVPVVFAIALSVFAAHLWANGLHTALMSSLAVALIACPCALAIATPLAIWAALANAAGHGVVFRTSDDLIALSEINHVCLDKTGTLTTNRPRLSAARYLRGAPGQANHVTQLLAAQTNHPLASALQDQLWPQTHHHVSIGPATTVPGRGVSAPITQRSNPHPLSTRAILGSPEYCDEMHMEFSTKLQEARTAALSRGDALICVAWGSRVRGVFAFEESLRSDAKAAVASLQALGLGTSLLTGDQPGRAARAARQLGLGATARLLPGDKQAAIERLQATGNHVAMLGDGLNDAPALGTADVGVALGCGAEVTRDAADVCLLSSRLAVLPWAIELSRKTRATIRRNLIWAVAYNAVGMGLAATGRLNPIFAALAMVLSSGLVIAESLRLSFVSGPLVRQDGCSARNQTTERDAQTPASIRSLGAPAS